MLSSKEIAVYPTRRVALTLLAAGALGISAGTATAQQFPSRTVRIIVPVPPAGGVDFLSRALGQKVADSIGVPVSIDNRPGASAAIGTEQLARSAPDGYTLMMAYSAHA